jgi:LmbE family N-acetylglucosaminyl deacetylase
LTALPPSALEDAVLVVAHPDDEILWFGSVVARMKLIVVAFEDCPDVPTLGAARRAALTRHPLAGRILRLQLTETGSFNKFDWARPEFIGGVPTTGHVGSDNALRDQARNLANALSPVLGEFKNLYTHNPWGEYGHEEHILVSGVATQLAADRSLRVWYSNYASNRSQALMTRYLKGFGRPVFSETIDTGAMQKASNCYREAGCWTWFSDYAWFDREYFVEGPLAESEAPGEGSVFPVNFIRVRQANRISGRPRSTAQRMKRRLLRLLSRKP